MKEAGPGEGVDGKQTPIRLDLRHAIDRKPGQGNHTSAAVATTTTTGKDVGVAVDAGERK